MKTAPDNNEKKSTKEVWIYMLAGFGALCLVGFLAWGVFIVASRTNVQEPAPEQPSVVSETPSTTTEERLDETSLEGQEGEDEFGAYVLNASGGKNYTQLLNEEPITVDWHKGAKRVRGEQLNTLLYEDSLELKNISEQPEAKCTEDGGTCSRYLYELGVIRSPERFAGKMVYLSLEYFSGLGSGFYGNMGMYLDDTQESFIQFVDNDFAPYASEKFIIQDFSELKPPSTIDIPNQEAHLAFFSSLRDNSPFVQIGASNNRGGIVDVAKEIIAEPYPSNTVVFADPEFGPVYFADGAFQIFLPDGSVQQYELIPEFLSKPGGETKEAYPSAYEASVNWTNGNNSNDTYLLGGEISRAVGCGSGFLRFTNIVNNREWFNESNLVQIGTSASGKPIYELSDKATNSHYRALFDFGYAAAMYLETGEPQHNEEFTDEDYQDFIEDTPLFFAKDDMGNWRSYRKSKYQTLAECGKPVVYLYPEYEMDVRVEIEPNGGLTKVDPVYPDGGWVVRATPNSELYNYDDKTVYPYLFWEGKADGFTFPEQGFVFAREDVSVEMRALLYDTGLNNTETEDFMEFWEEKLTVEPYVFVTFASERAFEQSAPLRVTPAPDATLRVFMYYEPLEEPKTVQPLPIQTFERRGFTVVEWGGVLHGFEQR